MFVIVGVWTKQSRSHCAKAVRDAKNCMFVINSLRLCILTKFSVF